MKRLDVPVATPEDFDELNALAGVGPHGASPVRPIANHAGVFRRFPDTFQRREMRVERESTDCYPAKQFIKLNNGIGRRLRWPVFSDFNQAEMFWYLIGLINQNRIGREPGGIPAIGASPRGLSAPPSLLRADV